MNEPSSSLYFIPNKLEENIVALGVQVNPVRANIFRQSRFFQSISVHGINAFSRFAKSRYYILLTVASRHPSGNRFVQFTSFVNGRFTPKGNVALVCRLSRLSTATSNSLRTCRPRLQSDSHGLIALAVHQFSASVAPEPAHRYERSPILPKMSTLVIRLRATHRGQV